MNGYPKPVQCPGVPRLIGNGRKFSRLGHCRARDWRPQAGGRKFSRLAHRRARDWRPQAGGHQRVLTPAGREADVVGIPTSSVASGTMTQDPLERLPESVSHMIEWVRQGAGERFEALELSLVPSIIITDNRQAAAEQYIHGHGWGGICMDQVLSMPSVFIGTQDQIAADMLARRKQYGFSYHVVGDEQREELAPLVARLAGE